MSLYNFKFPSSYSGFWSLNEKVPQTPGVLSLSGNAFKLDLHSQTSISEWRNIKSSEKIYGCATNNEDGYVYFFILDHPSYFSHIQASINRVSFIIDSIVLCEKREIKRDLIKSTCIRTSLCDKWFHEEIINSFHYNDGNGTQYKSMLSFSQHPKIYLYRGSKRSIYVYFGFCYNQKQLMRAIDSRAFINIDFNNRLLTESEADEETRKISQFFTLLWDESFDPEFVSYRSDNNEYCKKVSERCSYKCIDTLYPKSIYSSYEDFANEDLLQSMIDKWLNLYNDYSDAIYTYFDTISNYRIAPGLVLKNYISVLDALSSINFCAKEKKLSDKVPELLRILEPYTIAEQVKQRILKLFTTEIEKFLKERIRELVKSLHGLISEKITEDFITKAVNTRHNMTHPKKKYANCFSEEDLPDVNIYLSQIIRAFYMQKIGVPNETIMKIVVSLS